jgi:hypothetical protein
MEGSWTFAGCVISDSTSSTPSHAFHTNRFTPTKTGFAGSESAGWDFHRTSLTCPQIKRRSKDSKDPAPAREAPKHRGRRMPDVARIALLPPGKVRQGNY